MAQLNQTYLTSSDLHMLDGVLRDALWDLVRLKAVPLERSGYFEAKNRLAILLMKDANQGERCPETLRRRIVLEGFLASNGAAENPAMAVAASTSPAPGP